MAEPEFRGTVKSVVRRDGGQMRYAFITPDDGGADVFVLPSATESGDCREGDRLSYTVVREPRGCRATSARQES